MVKIISATAVLLMMASGTALASDSYLCKHGNQTRTISVVYNTPGQMVPCEVLYEKAEGTQSLWNANSQEGYCEAKAEAFVEKQRGWGWECAKQ